MSFKDLGFLHLDLSVAHADHQVGEVWGSIGFATVLTTNATLPFNLEIMRGQQGAWLSLTNTVEAGAFAQVIIKGEKER
ncbi:unnamed protein product [marine sediment metagenome]|uniref:Uncharacterized protein n=1 Tax=marine sediment metagenome TaxID=412755 RepID=X1R0G6_9ZZZZ